MSQAVARDRIVRRSPEPTTATMGMLLFILTEATLFATFLVSYFFLRFQSAPRWPPDGIEPPTLLLPSVMTIILLSSSVPMHLAEVGIRKGSRRQLHLGLLLSFVLGAVFLALQGFEYAESLKEFTPGANAYGSLFFLITGFHGAHVLAGLLLNLWVQVQARRGFFSQERHLTVRNVALYWHFVDAVWIAIFSSLYLAAR